MLRELFQKFQPLQCFYLLYGQYFLERVREFKSQNFPFFFYSRRRMYQYNEDEKLKNFSFLAVKFITFVRQYCKQRGIILIICLNNNFYSHHHHHQHNYYHYHHHYNYYHYHHHYKYFHFHHHYVNFIFKIVKVLLDLVCFAFRSFSCLHPLN